jgi:hypothetical protein
MNVPYNTGKVKIGQFYQRPQPVYETDRDMDSLQTALIGDIKALRRNKLHNTLYVFALVFALFALILGGPSMARAEAIASMPNKGGGKIVLTNEVCKYGEKTYPKLSRAYNYTDSGYGSDGCFYVEDETVVVIWNVNSEAKQMRYPAENFTILKRKTSGGTQI